MAMVPTRCPQLVETLLKDQVCSGMEMGQQRVDHQKQE